MKTAEETITETLESLEQQGLLVFKLDDLGWYAKMTILECIHNYARQVTAKTLQDASDKLTQAVGSWNADYQSQKRSIISTPIITP